MPAPIAGMAFKIMRKKGLPQQSSGCRQIWQRVIHTRCHICLQPGALT